jgi:hypothetical protein
MFALSAADANQKIQFFPNAPTICDTHSVIRVAYGPPVETLKIGRHVSWTLLLVVMSKI